MSRRARWTTGIALAALYVSVLAATARWSSHPVRPLFEGIGPTGPYAWVKPPPEFAANNTKPTGVTHDVPLTANGSQPSNATSTDGQIIIALGGGAIDPAPDATSAHLTATPLDPATLGPLPSPLRADGNAIQVALVYQPTNDPIPTLAKPGNLALQVPEAADAIYASRDGKTWSKLPSQAVGGPSTIGSRLEASGFYVAATSAPAKGTATQGSSSWNTGLVVAVTAALGIGLIVVAPLVWRRRSKRKKPPAKARAAKKTTKAPVKRAATQKRRPKR